LRVSVDHLTKRYGSLRALDDVSFEIGPGAIVAVLGQNGAGKTTLLRCLAAVASPSVGAVLFDGDLLSRARVDLRRRLFFLQDVPFLHGAATCLSHIGMVARLYDKEDVDPQKVWSILEDLDLVGSARAYTANLSRGQAYKTALASLFVVQPELAILDEPFASGMDPHGITVFKRWARRTSREGKTVVYSTQILELAETLSDRVVVLDHGKLHTHETVEGLRAHVSAGSDGVLAALVEDLREKSR
jgi:ABC-type multidrug transport system ATPase subunit